MRQACLTATVLALLLTLAGQAKADLIGYVTGPGDPWSVPPSDPGSNDAALNKAFGVGGWNKFTFPSAVGAGVFTGGYKMLFFDGGDGQSGNFETFINANRTALQNYVANGGTLFLNAARWSSGSLDLGFGATLTTNLFSTTGYAVDPSNPIFKGPNGSAGTSWTGNYFSHDVLTGAGLMPLITSDPNGLGNILLAQEKYGKGLVLFGGMTLPYWQSPATQAENLRANILSYTAAGVPATPEPSSLALFGLGAGLVGWLRWRRPSARPA
jgi:hypothetical protein